MIHVLEPGSSQPHDCEHFYFACDECGWCAQLRRDRDVAAHDGHCHAWLKALKARAK